MVEQVKVREFLQVRVFKVREFGSNWSLFYSGDNIPQCFVIYHIDVTLKQPTVYKVFSKWLGSIYNKYEAQ